MSKELALVANNPAQLNKAFGFEGKPKPEIPVLKVNGSDDEDGTRAPKGAFVLDDGDKVLYANEVTIRSFVKSYQYRLYDNEDPAKNDMSVIAPTFKAEFRSISGRIACGKMPKRAYMELGDNATGQQQYFQKKTSCKLLVFGLVSGTFTDLDTKKHVEVKDALFSWIVSQSGFMGVDAAITGIERERRAVPLTPIKLILKKEKNGSVTYYVPIPQVLNDTAKLDVERDGGYLERIKKFVKDTNDYINSRYAEATKHRAQNDDFKSVGEIIEGYDKKKVADMDDNIPF